MRKLKTMDELGLWDRPKLSEIWSMYDYDRKRKERLAAKKAMWSKARSKAHGALVQKRIRSIVTASTTPSHGGNVLVSKVANCTTTAITTQWASATNNSWSVYNIALPSAAGTVVAGWLSYDDITSYSGPDILRIESDGSLNLPKRAIKMPLGGGAMLYVDPDGNFRVDDKDAKVVYKASRVREFNRFVNASDLLAEFIRDLGPLGIKRGEVMTLEVGLFINWLIIRAAEADGDPVPTDVVPPQEHKLLKGRVNPRCLVCQRFVERAIAAQGFSFCTPAHAAKHFARLKAA